MINTYRYGEHRDVEKDGKKSTIRIPPKSVLHRMGAFIEVQITHPRKTQESFDQETKKVPSRMVTALIDTGAFSTVITPRTADDLGLIHTGYQKVTSVQDEQEQPVYYGMLVMPWGSAKETPLVACPLKNSDCLIGRDILFH